MGKLLTLAVVGVLTALIGSRLMRLRQIFLSRDLPQVEPSNCRLIEGIENGSEDIDILPNGLAFISTGLVYPGMVAFAPDKHGEIMLLDLNEKDSKPIILRFSHGFDMDSFNPHGISLYIDETDDEVYLFVVNHLKSVTTVEIFKFQEEENALLHLKTIHHELLHNVNDVIAVGPDSFYATNDHYFHNEIGRQAELFLDFGWTNVVYYSPSEVKEVATGFSMANGVAISPDSKYLYVADPVGQSIHALEKHANWTVTPVKVLPVETLVDNLSVDPVTGDVWGGCHPDAAKLYHYDPANPPGSEVIRVQNILSEYPIITRVYVNNGSILQASTIACVHDRNLLVGTIFHKALRCDLD